MERYLIVFGSTRAGATRFRLHVCTSAEWPRYERNGWLLVGIDPEPDRYESAEESDTA